MVILSVKCLNASGTGSFTPGCRLSSWAAAATDTAYSALAAKIKVFSSKSLICSISSLTLG